MKAFLPALAVQAVNLRLDPFLEQITPKLEPTHPLMFHENEDYNSVPDPMTNKRYMTSTQAKLISENQTDLAMEPVGLDPQFHVAYNQYAPEPTSKGYGDSEGASGSNGFAWTAYVQEEDDVPADASNVQIRWMVDADYGENDENMVPREAYATGLGQTKVSGWSNPLAWTDDGGDDDAVLSQQRSKIRLVRAFDEDDVALVQIRDDDDEEEESNDQEDEVAALTAESIDTEHKVIVDLGEGDADIL